MTEKLKVYPSYKSSGIDWLGEIPSHWGLTKLKYYSEIYSGKPSLEISKNFSERLKYPVYGGGNILGYSSDYNCDPNTIILGRVGGDGHTRLIKTKFWATDNSLVINTPLNSSYLFNLLNVAELLRLNTSTAQPLLTASKIGNQILSVPPKDEQEAIAAYLDDVTAKIDALIAEKRAQVEDLRSYRISLITETVTRGLNHDAPLRPSGIDWLGNIPEHWEISKIKYIGEIHGRIGYRGYTTEDLVEEGQGAYVIGGKHISKNILDLSSPDFISWEKYYESPEIMIKRGDIVIAQRGTLKRAAIIRDEIGCATINPSLALLNNISVNAIFLHYYLCSNAVTKFIDYLNTQTAVPMISQNQIENIHVVIPPLSEQHAIAEFLDEKTEKIDALIDELRKQLDELSKYKKAVISEAVTGKVDVRDWIPKS